MAQLSFTNGESSYALSFFLPNVETDSNNIWIGAVRTGKNQAGWRYPLQPAPGSFTDGNVRWGKGQPDDRWDLRSLYCASFITRRYLYQRAIS